MPQTKVLLVDVQDMGERNTVQLRLTVRLSIAGIEVVLDQYSEDTLRVEYTHMNDKPMLMVTRHAMGKPNEILATIPIDEYISPGDSVDVPEPEQYDMWEHGFCGTVVDWVSPGVMAVEDQKGEVYDIFIWRLKKVTE